MLSFASAAWILFSWGAETWDLGEKSGWYCVMEAERSAIGRNVMTSIPVSFLFVNGRIITSIAFRILALSNAFSFTLLTDVIVRSSAEGGDGQVNERECSHKYKQYSDLCL